VADPYRNILCFPSQLSSRSRTANRPRCAYTRPSSRRRAGGVTWPWFLFPLIEPDWQISRIRLSEKIHAFAHGRLAVRCGN
jgi:hypothetical protein